MFNAKVSALPSSPAPRAATLPPGMAVGIVAMVSAALAMSISPSLVRLADVGPFASAFWRVALALPILWLWMRQAEAAAPADTPRASFAGPPSWPESSSPGICSSGTCR